MFAKRHICDWPGAIDSVGLYRELIRRVVLIESPLPATAPSATRMSRSANSFCEMVLSEGFRFSMWPTTIMPDIPPNTCSSVMWCMCEWYQARPGGSSEPSWNTYVNCLPGSTSRNTLSPVPDGVTWNPWKWRLVGSDSRLTSVTLSRSPGFRYSVGPVNDPL